MSVSLRLPLPACILFQCFTFSINHVCSQLILFQFSVSFFPSPSLFLCCSFFSFRFPPAAFSRHPVSPSSLCHTPSVLHSSFHSPLHAEPWHTSSAFVFFLPASIHPSIHPFIYPLPFCGCIAGGGVADACLPGFWGAAGVCNDHGKTYALYAITVIRRNQDGSEDCWKTYRRYSDFHDFHMRITEQVRVRACVTRQNPTNGSKRGSMTGDLSGFLVQFENLASILKLPGKKTFNNMDRDFLEKRKKDLNAYLQVRL